MAKATLFDINEEISILEEALTETEDLSAEEEVAAIKERLELAEGKREEKLLSVARWRKNLKDEMDGVIGGEIKRLTARKKSYQRRVDSVGEYLKFNLSTFLPGGVKGPMGALSLVNSKPSVVIEDAQQVPNEFFVSVDALIYGMKTLDLSAGTYRMIRADNNVVLGRLDKDSILRHHQETGEIPPGVEIKRGQHVMFR